MMPPYGITSAEPTPGWQRRSACRDLTPETAAAYYDNTGSIGRNPTPVPPEAVALCESCPVRSECLKAGLAEPRVPRRLVWGGLLPGDLDRLRDRLADHGIVIPLHERPPMQSLGLREGDYEGRREPAPTPLSEALAAVAGDPDRVLAVIADFRPRPSAAHPADCGYEGEDEDARSFAAERNGRRGTTAGDDLVPAATTLAIVEGLLAEGYLKKEVQELLGLSKTGLRILGSKGTVRRSTAERAAHIADQLCSERRVA